MGKCVCGHHHCPNCENQLDEIPASYCFTCPVCGKEFTLLEIIDRDQRVANIDIAELYEE